MTKEEIALESLAQRVKDQRAQAWQQVGLLLPLLASEIRKHVRLIRTVRPRGNCRLCGLPRPHKDHAARSYHARYRHRSNAVHKFLDRLTPEERVAHTEKARAASVALRHQTWLEALPPRLVKTQGRDLALRYWRALSSHQQRKLLRARKARLAAVAAFEAAERTNPLA